MVCTWTLCDAERYNFGYRVAPIGGISGPFNDTGATATIFYGDGSNFVNGSVGLGFVEIAGVSIPNQGSAYSYSFFLEHLTNPNNLS